MSSASNPSIEDIKTLIQGIDENFPQKTTVVLLGQSYTSTQLKEAFQARVDKGAATVSARSAYRTAVKEERAAVQSIQPLRQAFRAHITGQFGADSEELSKYGFTPRTTKKLPVAAKAQAVEQAVATRKARNPLSKEEKKRIKGVVATPSTPAASAAPAPSAAVVTAAPQTSSATNGTTQTNGH